MLEEEALFTARDGRGTVGTQYYSCRDEREQL